MCIPNFTEDETISYNRLNRFIEFILRTDYITSSAQGLDSIKSQQLSAGR